MLKHYTAKDFEESIIKNKNSAIVDFWATWCGPCRMLTPTVEALADELDGMLEVGKVDVDECRELAMTYGVMSVPSLIFFKGGEEVARLIGVQSREKIIATAKEHSL